MNARLLLCFALIATSCFVVSARADLLAWQDFEGNTTTNGLDGSGDAASLAAANASLGVTAPGTVWDSGLGLPWSLALFDPQLDGGPLEPVDSGDVIGVVDGSYLFAPDGGGTNHLSGAANSDGNWMHVDDGDEGIVITFDPIDATGHVDLQLAFTWAANDTSYEPDDFLDVSVNGTSVFNVAGSVGATTHSTIEDSEHLNQFSPESISLSAFDGQTLNLVVTLATSSAAEDLGFDNLEVTGTVVPEPASLGMLSLALASFAQRYRRDCRY